MFNIREHTKFKKIKYFIYIQGANRRVTSHQYYWWVKPILLIGEISNTNNRPFIYWPITYLILPLLIPWAPAQIITDSVQGAARP